MDHTPELYQINTPKLCIQYKVMQLTMHRGFATAHSVSATRDNFVVRLFRKDNENLVCGYGECGLPPKKPGCYSSDVSDCFSFMKDLQISVSTAQYPPPKSETIEKIPIGTSHSFLKSMSSLQFEGLDDILLLLLLISQPLEDKYLSPKSAVEFAIFDLCAKMRETSLLEFIHGELPSEHQIYSFYSVSFEDTQAMLQNAKQHLAHTKCIKFKFNNQIKLLLELVRRIVDERVGDTLIIDANCSWSLQDYCYFEESVSHIEGFLDRLLYIEQPFDLSINDIEGWASVKGTTKMRILADQSFRNELDIPTIARVSHAVNIKIQKTGGLLAAIRAAYKVKQVGLQLMFGTMVCTQLGCSQTYCLAPLAKYMDADGSLLVKHPVVEGGFRWSQGGKIQSDFRSHGLGVDCRTLDNQFGHQ